MKTLAELEWLAIGNEPAGLWLLSRLQHELSAGFKKPELGWWHLGPEPEPLSLPVALAQKLEIPHQKRFHPEILAPGLRQIWKPETLYQKYPLLKDISLDALLVTQGHSQWKLLTRALRKYPELYPYTLALWEAFGRAPELSQEGNLAAALLVSELCWWSPRSFHAPVHEFSFLPEEIESIQLQKDGMIRIECIEGLIFAQKLILNANHHWLSALTHKMKKPQYFWDGAKLSEKAKLDFKIELTEKSIPAPVGGLTVWMQDSQLPESSEIFPLFRAPLRGKEQLTFNISVHSEVYLPDLSTQLKRAMQVFNKFFPFSEKEVLSLSFPLDAESCVSEDHRLRLLEKAESEIKEIYLNSRFHPKARHPNVVFLAPSVCCHLPYPTGPLLIAFNLLPELVDKRKVRDKVKDLNRSGGLTLQGPR